MSEVRDSQSYFMCLSENYSGSNNSYVDILSALLDTHFDFVIRPESWLQSDCVK